MLIVTRTVLGLDRYGGQYNVIPDTSPYEFHYRFYSDPGQTGVNDFEYRSQLDTITTIWKSTDTLSECSRWKAANLILETRMDIYMDYPPGVSRSSVPWDATSLVFYSTSAAVSRGLISTDTVNYQVAYSTIQICEEGKDLNFR